MGKVILEFDSIEEQDDIKSALDGYKWKLAMWELDQKLRSIVKYDSSIINRNEPASAIEVNVADKLRDELREIISSYDLIME